MNVDSPLIDRLTHRALAQNSRAQNSRAMSATNPVATRAILAALLAGLLLAGCSREDELPAASAEQQDLRQHCAELASQTLAENLITQSSELIIAGEPAREYCVVTIAIQDSRLRFNTWLPTD